jgi:uncharacterized protein YceH (UPF0502 family)
MKTLTDIEARVLGALIEKELITPEYYPLSLNALVNACNQKSNREPPMNLDDDAVSDALRTLQKEGVAGPADGIDNRVTKYEHRLQEQFNFDRRETAVLCELLLRGPQTPGELRGRASRMHPFEEIGQVQTALQRLMQREPPIVKVLPRQPGTKESRYAQLLSGDAAAAEAQTPQAHAAEPSSIETRASGADRISRLETEVAALHQELAEVKAQLDTFRKQFE